jgi:hypothetical protein
VDESQPLGDGSEPVDCQGHGTHVAGVAVGRTLGVARCATVHAVRQGLTPVHVRAQLEQLQDTFWVMLGYTVDRRARVELKPERV